MTLTERLRRLDVTTVIMWIIGGLLLFFIVLGSIQSILKGTYTPAQWFDFFVFGISQGSIYALIALGYTMVYGILKMINFAHGEVFMMGALTTYFLADEMNRRGVFDDKGALGPTLLSTLFGLIVLFAVAIFISMTVAVLLERVAYRPLRGAPRLVPLITAIGASFFLQYTARGLYGSNNRSYPNVDLLKGTVTFGQFSIQVVQIVVAVTAIAMMIGLYLFVQRTKTGKAILAVAEDKQAAALMGIDVDRTIVITFALGGAMAGVAAILYAIMFRQAHFFMGFIPGIKAFTAAVLGGIGNIPGAMLGGLFLGIFESLGPTLFLDGLGINSPNQLKDVIAFTMLVLILIFRPTGIIGERLSEKKA
ncbi:MAG: branched-chain amino acid ABC transporter permease [Anaerolineales bacterium]|nr:branched-chain amino acid ABC transporter permease [Anaerolineales bacterium]MCB9127839.1 branched-chain amino acid ABC transporter permease [Ardenticatenales bacterium]MCB9172906.1 branched-chain amino acid ABC transporter permease [Ardenticatenales bacterium]